MTYEEAKQFAEENGKYLQPLLFSLPKVVADIVSLSCEKKKKEEKWKHCIIIILRNCLSSYVLFLVFSSILPNFKSVCCFTVSLCM